MMSRSGGESFCVFAEAVHREAQILAPGAHIFDAVIVDLALGRAVVPPPAQVHRYVE